MSERRSTHHVAIVGAGPSGLALALLLARIGLRVALIERQPRGPHSTGAKSP
jgi:2-polyprenyl-6-methoxyphenol hydroxylase-like FAD-dependent oxidoreductase